MILVIPSDQVLFKIDNTDTGLVLKKRDPGTEGWTVLATADVDPETGEWTLMDTAHTAEKHTEDPDDAVSILWEWRFGFANHHPLCECDACMPEAEPVGWLNADVAYKQACARMLAEVA